MGNSRIGKYTMGDSSGRDGAREAGRSEDPDPDANGAGMTVQVLAWF